MTPKQTERLKKKIADIKKALASEKRKYGAYDDSRGLRYLPTTYFISLGDYSGGLAYIRWFYRNFPDDTGFPDFLFEQTIILFKTGKLKEAEKKAFQTFCRNTYLFDKYFGRTMIPIGKWEGSNLAAPAFAEHLGYSSQQPELSDFTHWLHNYTGSQKFVSLSADYIDLYKQLNTEQDQNRRLELLDRASQLEESA